MQGAGGRRPVRSARRTQRHVGSLGRRPTYTNGIAAQIAETMKLRHKEILPVFIIADTFNRVVFVSQGYTIGLGEQLMKTVEGL